MAARPGSDTRMRLAYLFFLLALACEAAPEKTRVSEPRLGPPLDLARGDLGYREDFEAAFGLLGLPSGWRPVESRSQGLRASWGPAPGRGAGKGLAVLEGRGFEDAVHAVLLPQRLGKRGRLDVSFRALGGHSESGAAVVFWRDDLHFDLLVWDALRSELRFESQDGEQRRVLARVLLSPGPRAWKRLTISWDGRQLYAQQGEASLQGSLAPGLTRLGLACLGDARAVFDDLYLR